MTPGTRVLVSPAYLEASEADRAAVFTVAEPCPPRSSRKGKPSCYLCARGLVRLTDGRHFHPDNLIPDRR